MAKRSFRPVNKTKGHKWTFFVSVLIVVLAGILAATGLTIREPGTGRLLPIHGVSEMRFGIDIRGGVEAVYAPAEFEGKPTDQQLDAVRTILETRLDNLNILDRDVIVDRTNSRVTVRFPWKATETDFNPDTAMKELGETAKLSFVGPDGVEILSGADVKSASVGSIPKAGGQPEYVVQLTLNPTGVQRFADATQKFMGQEISIKMDTTTISSPRVQAHITNGEAIISPMESAEVAVALQDKINAGALPFAITAVSSRSISPALGSSALDVMVQAGMVAFLFLCAALILYYRLSGFVASIALTAQVIGILLAISIPQQTLTLQGIAGIILSVGMGVDANVIVSERIREEIRGGATVMQAVETGFDKAFSSILDGNVTVAISAICLIVLGSGSMLSFGYSLLVGVILNLVCGATLSHFMTRSLVQFKTFRNPRWFLSVKSNAKEVQANV